jgi:hypothetical protein
LPLDPRWLLKSGFPNEVLGTGDWIPNDQNFLIRDSNRPPSGKRWATSLQAFRSFPNDDQANQQYN